MFQPQLSAILRELSTYLDVTGILHMICRIPAIQVETYAANTKKLEGSLRMANSLG
jgi:hypothetical protein